MAYASTETIYAAFLKAGQKISTDTRNLVPGSVFFALKGSNFDGNNFVDQALQSGCLAAVSDRAEFAGHAQVFYVQDVLKALQSLANHHRRQFSFPFLAITGSNGKTTNKELITAVLSRKYQVLATKGNLNNHIGVPLTILGITGKHDFAVIEMGANHQGEIRELCEIADPDFGLITNVGKAHLEGFGGIEGVKKGKGELLDHLRAKGGKTFINGDDDVLYQMAFSNDKITYGCKKLYDVIGKDYSNSETVSFKFTTRYGDKDFNKRSLISTQIVGHYNLVNCLAAACVGNYFKVEDEDIRAALEEYVPEMNRSQLVKTQKNTIILDAYNANPNSMKAALDNFRKYPAEKKLVLLGDMFELGEHSREEHEQVVQILREHKLTETVLVGESFSGLHADGFRSFRSTAECLAYLQQHPYSGYTVLIKGSRGMKMETLQQAL